MSTRNANSYMTLTEFKAEIGISSTDTTDDTLMERILEEASRDIDDECGRFFYPAYDTKYYDTPTDDNELYVYHDDLLEVVTLTNGSDGSIDSTSYNLIPYNATPYYGIAFKRSLSLTWESDSDDDLERAISIAGFWGYRQHYSRDGWHTITTLSGGEDIDTTVLSVTSDTLFVAGDIIRIDNEMMLVASASGSNTITVTERGWNGSTAATHDSGAAVKRWYTEPAIVKATGILAHRLFQRRNAPFGIAGSITAGGELRLLQEMDPDVYRLIRPFKRMI